MLNEAYISIKHTDVDSHSPITVFYAQVFIEPFFKCKPLSDIKLLFSLLFFNYDYQYNKAAVENVEYWLTTVAPKKGFNEAKLVKITKLYYRMKRSYNLI